MKFKKGDLLLVKNNSIIGALIRRATDSPYNHVGMFCSPDAIIEAKFRCVTKTSLKEFEEAYQLGKLEYAVYRWKKIKKKQIDTMVSYMERQMGRGYDLIQFLCLGLYLLFKVSLRLEPIDISNRWLCSELISEAAYEAGIKFEECIDPDNITPGDIARSSLVKKIYDVREDKKGSWN